METIPSQAAGQRMAASQRFGKMINRVQHLIRWRQGRHPSGIPGFNPSDDEIARRARKFTEQVKDITFITTTMGGQEDQAHKGSSQIKTYVVFTADILTFMEPALSVASHLLDFHSPTWAVITGDWYEVASHGDVFIVALPYAFGSMGTITTRLPLWFRRPAIDFEQISGETLFPAADDGRLFKMRTFRSKPRDTQAAKETERFIKKFGKLMCLSHD